MENKMQSADIAGYLENLIEDMEASDFRVNDRDKRYIGYAASILRKIETGELVEVVRCGECVGWEEKDGCFPICNLRSKADFRPHKDGFCDMGERKDGDTNV